MTLSLANDLEEIAVVGARIDEFCESHDIPPQVAYAVNVSVDELLNNTISYGYADDEPHTIELSLRLDAGAVVVRIVDDGQEFESSGVPAPDTEAALEDRPLGGLGLFIVHQMMDSVEFRREDGRNIATLVKNTEMKTDDGGSPDR